MINERGSKRSNFSVLTLWIGKIYKPEILLLRIVRRGGRTLLWTLFLYSNAPLTGTSGNTSMIVISCDAIIVMIVARNSTWACLFGSRRNRHPICWALMCTIPAQTKLSGLGSMPSSSCMPKPCSFVRTCARSIGVEALNIFWERCWFVLRYEVHV